MKCRTVEREVFCLFLSFIFAVVAQESYLEIYEHPNYGGQKYVLHESTDFLGEFNDKASSFKVRIYFVTVIFFTCNAC